MRLLTIVLIAASATGAGAQQREMDDVRLHNDCRLAAQVLATGNPAPMRAWALDHAAACDESGGAALASAWAKVGNDTILLARLHWATAALRDARVWDATSAVARDAARPLEVRLTALSLLPTFAVPSIRVYPETLREPSRMPLLPAILDYPLVEGSQPLPPDIGARSLTVLLELASSDADPTVRAAARWLHDGLALRMKSISKR